MLYSIAVGDELCECTKLIRNCEYYDDDVDMFDAGGFVLQARKEDGTLAGCVWAGCVYRRAYLDYLVVKPNFKGTAPRLLKKMQGLLQSAGIKEVFINVHQDNTTSHKMAVVFGAKLDGPYYLGVVKLGDPDGQEEN